MPEEEPKSITGKILASHERITATPTGAGKDEADRLGAKAIKAILAGMKTQEGLPTKAWEEYMQEFALGNAKQLARLCGQDYFCEKIEYGAECLAYIVSNSTCTIQTHTGTKAEENKGTLNFIKDEALKELNYTVTSE